MSHRSLGPALAALSLLALAASARSQPLAIASDVDPAPGGGSFAPHPFIPSAVLLDGGAVAVAALVQTGLGTSQRLLLFPASGAPAVLVQKGDAAPGTSGSFQRFVRVRGRGPQVTFSAEVTGPNVDGIFGVRPGEPVEALVLRGDAAPAAVGGSYELLFGEHRSNTGGDVAFDAALSTSGSPSGLFLSPSDGPDFVVVVAGDPVPEAGGSFFGTRLEALSDLGEVVFSAGIAGGAANLGLFQWSPGGGIEALVLDTDPVPIGGELLDGIQSAAINDAGEVAFIAVGWAEGQSLIRLRDGDMQVLAAVGGPAPNGGTYSHLHRVEIDQSGRIAFTAEFEIDEWAFLTASPDSAAVIAFQRGDPLAGVAGGGATVGGLESRFAFSDAGFFAMPATFAQGSGGGQAVVVPEPAATAQVAAGILLLVGLARRARPRG